MATFTWAGGYGFYNTAQFWAMQSGAAQSGAPGGVPGAGDMAVVQAGEVVVQGLQAAAMVQIGAPGGTAPVLDLRGASLDSLTMPCGLPAQPFATVASPVQHATVNVRGQSRIGSIAIGACADMVRAPGPYGHGALKAPDDLTVNLEPQAVLSAGFDVKDGSTLTVNGDGTAAFRAGASMVEGGHVVIGAALLGQGTITMTNGAMVSPTGSAGVGTLELAGRVGAGEAIDIRMGTLLIDAPMQFAGTIGIRASEGSGAYGPQSVLLRGLAASSFGFDDATHRMTLWGGGGTVLDTVQFSADMVSASFKTGQFASLDVLQTGDGVLLRGLYSVSPAGAVELPRH